jgi:hypothetical protein
MSFSLISGETDRRHNSQAVTKGRILQCEVRKIDRLSLGLDTDRGRFDYEAVVEFQYVVAGQTYLSTSLFERLPAVFSREDLAGEMVRKFAPGTETEVYYSTENPRNGWLINSSLGIGMKIFVVLLLLAVGLMFLAALVFTIRRSAHS